MNCCTVTKKKIAIGALVLYVVASAVFILYTLYQQIIVAVHESGKRVVIAGLLQEATKEECKPFSVYSGDKVVQLINVDCLKKQAEEGKTETSPTHGAEKK